jgi:hypothetical protein
VHREDRRTDELHDLAKELGDERDVATFYPNVVKDLHSTIESWQKDALPPLVEAAPMAGAPACCDVSGGGE